MNVCPAMMSYRARASPYRILFLHTENRRTGFPIRRQTSLFAEQVAVCPGAGQRQHQHIILDTVNE